jgi:hypothetical protein
VSDLQKITGDNWEEFLHAKTAILIIERNNCQACLSWSKELESLTLKAPINIGKLNLDDTGLGRFKIEHNWVSDIDVLPFNTIFIEGEMKEYWAGGGLERLLSRLNKFV